MSTFDFIHNKTDVDNQPNESSEQNVHGTAVLSTIGKFTLINDTNFYVVGSLNSSLIGVAFNANFLLAKTEVVDSETIVEEDYFAMAVEWGENNGADIVTASLGYSSWYTYNQIDGETAICTQAINKAVRDKGKRYKLCIAND